LKAINRAKYWLALLIVICWMLFVLMVLAGIAKLAGATDHRLAIGWRNPNQARGQVCVGTSEASWNLFRSMLAHRHHRMLSERHD
jgi:uncharacterized membrane protein YhaH (DUF805 family)